MADDLDALAAALREISEVLDHLVLGAENRDLSREARDWERWLTDLAHEIRCRVRNVKDGAAPKRPWREMGWWPRRIGPFPRRGPLDELLVEPPRPWVRVVIGETAGDAVGVTQVLTERCVPGRLTGPYPCPGSARGRLARRRRSARPERSRPPRGLLL